jgi:hypothetical protein
MEYNSLFIFSPSNPVRVLAARITTHKYFEYIIIVLIVLSSILLAMDGPNLSKDGPFFDETLTPSNQKLKVGPDR